MKKLTTEIETNENEKKAISVWLDNETAQLLNECNDEVLKHTYIVEEYNAKLIERKETRRHQSLDEDAENGIDYEDKRSYEEFSFEDCENENLQKAIKQLTPRQQEILRLMYIEGRTQKEIAEKYGVSESAISHAIERIYASIQKNYKKN